MKLQGDQSISEGGAGVSVDKRAGASNQARSCREGRHPGSERTRTKFKKQSGRQLRNGKLELGPMKFLPSATILHSPLLTSTASQTVLQ